MLCSELCSVSDSEEVAATAACNHNNKCKTERKENTNQILENQLISFYPGSPSAVMRCLKKGGLIKFRIKLC